MRHDSRVRTRPDDQRIAAPYDWRTPAAWWVHHELGVPADRLLRVVDVRPMTPTEAWVAFELDGRQVVVGLRLERCPRRGDTGSSEHWCQLLYLHDSGHPSVSPAVREHDSDGGYAAQVSAAPAGTPAVVPTDDCCPHDERTKDQSCSHAVRPPSCWPSTSDTTPP